MSLGRIGDGDDKGGGERVPRGGAWNVAGEVGARWAATATRVHLKHSSMLTPSPTHSNSERRKHGLRSAVDVRSCFCLGSNLFGNTARVLWKSLVVSGRFNMQAHPDHAYSHLGTRWNCSGTIWSFVGLCAGGGGGRPIFYVVFLLLMRSNSSDK